ncbi:MAG TPA: hypothetical protein VN950_01915 [Terriglobales bacterium]|nr:hypothetical protein [Terriglobales bacterium]
MILRLSVSDLSQNQEGSETRNDRRNATYDMSSTPFGLAYVDAKSGYRISTHREDEMTSILRSPF